MLIFATFLIIFRKFYGLKLVISGSVTGISHQKYCNTSVSCRKTHHNIDSEMIVTAHIHNYSFILSNRIDSLKILPLKFTCATLQRQGIGELVLEEA